MIYVSRTTTTVETEVDIDPTPMITECVQHLVNNQGHYTPDNEAAELAPELIAAIAEGFDEDPSRQIDLLEELIVAAQNLRRDLKGFLRDVAIAEQEAMR